MILYFIILYHILICFVGTWKDFTKYKMPWHVLKQRWFQRVNRTDVLIHAVSCGEAMAMIPVMAYLTKCGIKYTLSIHTYTGYTLIKKMAPDDVNILLKPFDLLFNMFLFFGQLRPKAIIISESDTCPCFLFVAKLFRIPIFYMNYKYKPDKPLRNLLHRSIAKRIYTQNYCHGTSYAFVGNLKFLAVKKDKIRGGKHGLRPTIIIASAGEDEIEIHLNYIKAFPDVRFIYVPRHLSWDVKPYFDRLNQPYSVITENLSVIDNNILICSAFGMLEKLYKKSDICLMGDTFNNVGGHNLIEPAIQQNAIILGPNYHTCKEIADMLHITYVTSETDLIRHTKVLMENYTEIGQENQLRIYTYRREIKKAFKEAMDEIISTYSKKITY